MASSWQTWFPADVPRTISRAEYDRVRRVIYATVPGLGRLDDLLPKMAPPDAVVVTRADYDSPLYDTAVPISDLVPYESRVVERQEPDPRCASGRPVLGLRCPAYVTIREEVRDDWDGAALMPKWHERRDNSAERARMEELRRTGTGLERAAIVPPYVAWEEPTYDAARSGATRRVQMRIVGLAPKLRPKRPDKLLADAWWYYTPFGLELIEFIPPLALGQATPTSAGRGAFWPTSVHELPEEADVLVVDPHPFFGTSRAPKAFISVQWGKHTAPESVRVARVRSRRVVVAEMGGDRNSYGPQRHAEGVAIFFSHRASRPSGLTRTIDRVASSMSRDFAVRAIVTAVASIVTLGAAAPIVQAALSAARQAGVDPVKAIEIARRTDVVTATSNAAPEQVNDVLVTVAENAAYLDLLPFVGELSDLTLSELAVRAQESREERDELRLRLAAAHQRIAAQKWFVIADRTIDVVASAVLAAVTLGAAGPALAATMQGAQAALELVRAGTSAATAVVQLAKARIDMAAARRLAVAASAERARADGEREAALLSEIAHLEEELRASGRPVPEASAGASFSVSRPLAIGGALVIGAIALKKLMGGRQA